MLFETFLEAGDELLLPVPTYTMYEVYASSTDARVVCRAGRGRLAVSLRAPVGRHHAADQDHRHRQSQQPFRQRCHARAAAGNRRACASCRAAGRRSLLPLLRRDSHGSGRCCAQSDCGAHLLKGLRACRFASWIAGRAIGVDALDTPRALALQRELAGAGLFAARARRHRYLDWYIGEVLAARAEFEAALDAAKLRHWPSQANFVLVEIGAKHAEFAQQNALRPACWCATAPAIQAATDGCASPSEHESRCAMQLWLSTKCWPR